MGRPALLAQPWTNIYSTSELGSEGDMNRICYVTLVSYLLTTIGSLADSYTLTVPAAQGGNSGYSLIANQLDNGGNTLDEVLPNVPDQTQLSKVDCTTG